MIGMLSISMEDILPPEIFEKQREEITRRIIEIKKLRRVETKTFSFLFESRETVLNQINEMVYIERVRDQDEIQRLIRVYSDLLPGPGLLSVSMFIEFRDEKQLLQEMKNLTGIEDTVYLTFDGNQLKGTPEEGRSTETLESTLQYLKFSFTPEMARKFRAAGNVYIETRKPGYAESARIPAALLDQLKLEI